MADLHATPAAPAANAALTAPGAPAPGASGTVPVTAPSANDAPTASGTPTDGRLALTWRRGLAVYGVNVIGFMTANLVPLMIVSLVTEHGFAELDAGTLMTGCLLLTAVVCLAASRLAVGRARRILGAIGLGVMAAGYGLAALAPSAALAITGVLVGGAGAGAAVAAGGAAIAALRNPERASGIAGFVNRGVVTIVLFVVPLLGVTMGASFGVPALMAVACIAVIVWLPANPVAETAETAAPATTNASAPVTTNASAPAASAPSAAPAAPVSRATTIAGIVLLASFAAWALSEDSLWAIAAAMGGANAGLDDAGMSLVLSLSTLGGLVATALVSIAGHRLGRVAPLAIALVAGLACKAASGVIADPTLYIVVIIAWNTLYVFAFTYFIAIGAALDASGRWLAPLQGIYLVGSAFAPMFGTFIAAVLGYAAVGLITAAMTAVLAVPIIAVARYSARRAPAAAPAPSAGSPAPDSFNPASIA